MTSFWPWPNTAEARSHPGDRPREREEKHETSEQMSGAGTGRRAGAGPGRLRYYDGENIFFLPDTYAVAADGLAYDGAGNAYAAGWETPYYDPTDDWGDNWASNWG